MSAGLEARAAAPPRGTCRRSRGRSPPRGRSEPSSAIGLPVTIAGVWPWSLPYSSMNQAIVCALVLTSGAGMSRVGPSTFSILSMNERAIRCSSDGSSLLGGAVDAALGAAEGDAGDRGLPGHQRGERADLVDVDLGVEADAALVGAAGAVVLDPVAGEDVDLAVGELDRDLDGDLAVGGPEDDPEVVGEPEVVGGDVEVVADDVEVRDLGRLRLVFVLSVVSGALSGCSRSPTATALSSSAIRSSSPTAGFDPPTCPSIATGRAPFARRRRSGSTRLDGA